MEVIISLYVIGAAFLLLLLASIRSDWKDITEGRDRLREEWDRYYAETRKYMKMKQVKVTFLGGNERIYDATFIKSNEEYIELFDADEKVVSVIPLKDVQVVDVIRETEYTPGDRNLNDRY